jgi:hypothetical protein
VFAEDAFGVTRLHGETNYQQKQICVGNSFRQPHEYPLLGATAIVSRRYGGPASVGVAPFLRAMKSGPKSFSAVSALWARQRKRRLAIVGGPPRE